MYYPDDFKRKYGLTNSEIAQGINNLSDEDFLDVFIEFMKINGEINSDTSEKNYCKSIIKFSEWIKKSLLEIYYKEFNSVFNTGLNKNQLKDIKFIICNSHYKTYLHCDECELFGNCENIHKLDIKKESKIIERWAADNPDEVEHITYRYMI